MKLRVLILLLLLAAGAVVYYTSVSKPQEMILTGIVTTDDVIISAQIQGRLQELRVKQGDVVHKGQLVGVIQPEQWQADRAYFASGQQQATTQVAQAEADLRFQELQSKNLIEQSRANLEAAKAQVAQGMADLESARLSWNREDELFKQGAETAQAHDQARAAFDGQTARVESLRKQVRASEAALAIAESSVEQIEIRKAALDAMKHQRDAAAAQSEKAQVLLQYTQLAAPISGIVDVRAAMQGEVVNPGQAIVTLINPDDLWVRVDIEETYIDRIHIGDTMRVRLPSGRTLDGVVFYRAIDADYATQRDVSRTKRDIKTFEVRLRCDNHDRALAVGMSAYVTLDLADRIRPATNN